MYGIFSTFSPLGLLRMAGPIGPRLMRLRSDFHFRARHLFGDAGETAPTAEQVAAAEAKGEEALPTIDTATSPLLNYIYHLNTQTPATGMSFCDCCSCCGCCLCCPC